MRSHTRSRYYVRCDLDDKVKNWTDDAFGDELRRRLPPEEAENVITGPRLEMSIINTTFLFSKEIVQSVDKKADNLISAAFLSTLIHCEKRNQRDE